MPTVILLGGLESLAAEVYFVAEGGMQGLSGRFFCKPYAPSVARSHLTTVCATAASQPL